MGAASYEVAALGEPGLYDRPFGVLKATCSKETATEPGVVTLVPVTGGAVLRSPVKGNFHAGF